MESSTTSSHGLDRRPEAITPPAGRKLNFLLDGCSFILRGFAMIPLFVLLGILNQG